MEKSVIEAQLKLDCIQEAEFEDELVVLEEESR